MTQNKTRRTKQRTRRHKNKRTRRKRKLRGGSATPNLTGVWVLEDPKQVIDNCKQVIQLVLQDESIELFQSMGYTINESQVSSLKKMSLIINTFLSIFLKKSITLYETESGDISLTFNLGTSLTLMKRTINKILSLFKVDFDIDVFLKLYCRLGVTMRLPIQNFYLPYVVTKEGSTYTGEMMNVRGMVQVITPDTLQCSLDKESINLLFPSQKGGGNNIRQTITKDDVIESIVKATTFKLKKKTDNNQSKDWETKLTQVIDTMIQTYPLDSDDSDDSDDDDNDDNDDNDDGDSDETVSIQNKDSKPNPDISKQLSELLREISQIKQQMGEISNKL